MLLKFPPEILGLVVEKLKKADLKSLSLVSKYIHAVVTKPLWQSVTIEPSSEDRLYRIPTAALPRACLQNATKLSFHSDIRYVTTRRCPHEQLSPDVSDTDDGDDLEIEYRVSMRPGSPYFDRLNTKVQRILEQLGDDQLHSFSWDLGTCVPYEILGSYGILSLMHPSLRSLSLTTNFSCGFHSPELELGPFRQLQSLCWKAPNPWDLDTLYYAILNNSAHLQNLELDFVNWREVRNGRYMPEGEHDITTLGFFTGEVVDRTKPPSFPALRVLSLSQVPFGAVMARAINFETLVSLTLRLCPGWDQFLERVVQLNLPIKLKRFEIQDSTQVPIEAGERALAGFIDAFDTLEELFISHRGPVPSLQVWENVVRHQTTLKRFVYHQRSTYINDGFLPIEVEYDVPNLGIDQPDIWRIEDDPWENPLASLDLEYIGLACQPEILDNVLMPFTLKTSLKVLHIRQSGTDLIHHSSWGVRDRPTQGTSDTRSVTQSEIGWAGSDTTSEAEDECGLWDEFREFANWAFGPRGLPSLQVIALGDFGSGDWTIRKNVLLCKSTHGKSNFRLIGEHSLEWQEVLDEYRDALEACPTEPLLYG